MQINLSNYDLGVMQSEQTVHDVELPLWCAQDPYRFV